MTEEQERAKEWLRGLHEDVRKALIERYIKGKEKKRDEARR